MILEWIFELKLDGYRSPAVIEHGRAQLLSRNRHPFVSFAEVGTCITGAIPNIGRVASETSLSRLRFMIERKRGEAGSIRTSP